MHWACVGGQIAIVDYLISRGSNILDVSNNEVTCLMCCVMIEDQEKESDKRRAAIIRTLLSKAPDLIDRKDRDGSTAVHYASGFGMPKCVHALLDHRADITIRDRSGSTALELVRELANDPKCTDPSGRLECIDLLLTRWKELEQKVDKQILELFGADVANKRVGDNRRAQRRSKRRGKRKGRRKGKKKGGGRRHQTYSQMTRHAGVTCDGCYAYDVHTPVPDIVGPRYKCVTCEDFDLCEKCYLASLVVVQKDGEETKASSHGPGHSFIRIASSDDKSLVKERDEDAPRDVVNDSVDAPKVESSSSPPLLNATLDEEDAKENKEEEESDRSSSSENTDDAFLPVVSRLSTSPSSVAVVNARVQDVTSSHLKDGWTTVLKKGRTQQSSKAVQKKDGGDRKESGSRQILQSTATTTTRKGSDTWKIEMKRRHHRVLDGKKKALAVHWNERVINEPNSTTTSGAPSQMRTTEREREQTDLVPDDRSLQHDTTSKQSRLPQSSRSKTTRTSVGGESCVGSSFMRGGYSYFNTRPLLMLHRRHDEDDSSLRQRFFRSMHPRAKVLALELDHFMSRRLDELSSSQLDVLEDMHQAALDRIRDARIELARLDERRLISARVQLSRERHYARTGAFGDRP